MAATSSMLLATHTLLQSSIPQTCMGLSQNRIPHGGAKPAFHFDFLELIMGSTNPHGNWEHVWKCLSVAYSCIFMHILSVSTSGRLSVRAKNIYVAPLIRFHGYLSRVKHPWKLHGHSSLHLVVKIQVAGFCASASWTLRVHLMSNIWIHIINGKINFNQSIIVWIILDILVIWVHVILHVICVALWYMAYQFKTHGDKVI